MGLENLKLKNVSSRDKEMIRDIETMMGPEPSTMGFAKNLFWGRFQEEYVFPYPQTSEEETRKCDALLAELEDYLTNEHPSILIDQEEYIPEWAINRLFELGVMGMTVPEEYGGLGLGITSYNRVLEMIGAHCGSTSVMVSAHQSIGCKAIMLFGTEAQKKEFLPKVAREYLSAFCLSEPQVGSDAAGQETRAVRSKDGSHYILNGEKKWSTSGALSGMFTVMCKQRMADPKTGKETDKVTALICTPDMEGVEIFQKNRSKSCIRGTWQARIRFNNVKVPAANLLHKEGRGLNVALTCLNFGRCTLSAGITGAAKRAQDQATKWVQTRYQFGRPLADFELVQQRIARMHAFTFAADAMLYMMTGMLDRGDKDIMVETAMTKVFSSQIGWEVIDDAMQIMGGEAFMTENEIERLWRDNRIHRVVEGSNEVMQPFVFAYGGKQLAEQMIGIQEAIGWDTDEDPVSNLRRIVRNASNGRILQRAIPLGLQLFLGLKPSAPRISRVDASLQGHADRLARLVQDHSHFFKMASKWYREEIITRQVVQARIADNAVYLFALAASLSKMDHLVRSGAAGVEFDKDEAAFRHAFDLFALRIRQNITELKANADDSMAPAADAARKYNDSLPNADFYIHESSPIAGGTGKVVPTEHIRQFPGEAEVPAAAGDGAQGTPTVKPSRRVASKKGKAAGKA
ncbi:MAG: acyl-CoA dehydrogenase family protein [Rhodothermales bacterium]|nr:acyl-CoA dehydrogenase family protein [Rhodothermales bacterium]MBO6779820.1 acyl-CoA dehydrogenase family protein [Rhodothermales bacterium]